MMEFSNSKPIYRQIADYSYARILSGEWEPGAQVPSVRELAADLGVNSRTVMKAFEDLQATGMIIPRRGIGFILAEDAAEKATAERRKEFFSLTLPTVAEEMKRLGLDIKEVTERLREMMA